MISLRPFESVDRQRGAFDSREIGPWSRWQGGLGPTLMIVGQDWGTVGYFSKHAGLDGPRSKNPTNEALQALVRGTRDRDRPSRRRPASRRRGLPY